MVEFLAINPVVFLKNEALRELNQSKASSKSFIKKLLEHIDLFGSKNDQYQTTVQTKELKNYLNGASKLFDKIANTYHMQSGRDGIMNMYAHILSEARMKELLETNSIVFQKNQVLSQLYALREDFRKFVEELLKHEELFAAENEQHKPTRNRAELSNLIDKENVLFNKIAKAYYEKQQPELMMNVLRDILSEQRMKQLPNKHPIRIAKSTALYALYECEENINKFIGILCKHADLFVLEHETYWPTIHKAKLQELRTRISKNPKLFNSIAMQYFAQNQPIEMRNLLRHILSLKSMEALRSMNLLVVKKNLALIELSQLQTDFYGFSRALAKYKDLFASENDKHEPTFNVKDLENFIDKAHELFNRIAIFYFEEGKPEWMKNLFQYILSQKRVNELVDTNPLVFQKNLALIELQSKLYLTDFESELLKLKNLFAKENKAFKPTVNTKKLKAEIDGKPTFFDNIAKAYYAQGKPEWMKDALPYILSEPRMVEMLGSKVIRHTSGLNKVFNRNDIWSIVDSYLMIKTASVSSKRKYDDAFH